MLTFRYSPRIQCPLSNKGFQAKNILLPFGRTGFRPYSGATLEQAEDTQSQRSLSFGKRETANSAAATLQFLVPLHFSGFSSFLVDSALAAAAAVPAPGSSAAALLCFHKVAIELLTARWCRHCLMLLLSLAHIAPEDRFRSHASVCTR